MVLLRSNEKDYGSRLLDKFSQIVGGEVIESGQSSQRDIREIRAKDLVTGMIIAKDIVTIDGKRLITAGAQVNLLILEVLRNAVGRRFVMELFQVLIP